MEISAVDLFCGAGGLTYGLQQAGIDVTAGIDVNEACRYPYETNNDATFYRRDLTEVATDDPDWLADLFDETADVRLLAGGPPCQPYSTLNNGADPESHEKAGLVSTFGQLVELTDPGLVVMENVYGIRRDPEYDALIDVLERNGFYLNSKEDRAVDCPEYGIPQQRKRWITLASTIGPVELDSPDVVAMAPDHTPTVADRIGHLPPLQAGEQDDSDPLHAARDLSDTNRERIAISEPGGTWEDWIEKGRADLVADCHERDGGASYKAPYSRMKGDTIGPTITTQFYNYGSGRFGHYDTAQNRALSLREGACLQTFPDAYQFVEGDLSDVGIKTIGRLIGNAVPPRLAEAVGRSVVRHVSGLRQMTVLDYAE